MVSSEEKLVVMFYSPMNFFDTTPSGCIVSCCRGAAGDDVVEVVVEGLQLHFFGSFVNKWCLV